MAVSPVLAAARRSTIIRGSLSGLILSTVGSSATFAVAAGGAVDSSNADMMMLAAALSKTTAVWAVGSGNGALDTSTIAANTWYHVHLIKRPDTGATDVLISTSATAPTLPANYTLFRRIGSMLTNGSGQWVKFVENANEFLWDTVVADANTVAGINGSTLVALSVPLGVQVDAIFSSRIDFVTAGNAFFFTSPDQSAPTTGGPFTHIVANSAQAFSAIGPMLMRTNTSRQIRITGNSAGCTYNIVTSGWIDNRGRDA
jgi:hypothetical protein